MGRRVVVVTFCTAEYDVSAEVLRDTAISIGGADEVRVYRPSDVAAFFREFPDLLPESRGYGWWAWKPWIVHSSLRDLDEDDVLVYADAGIMFEGPLDEWTTADAVAAPITLFRLGGWKTTDYRVRAWTKGSALRAMGVDADSQLDSVQVSGAFQVYRACPTSVRFASEWLRWCSARDVVDDDSRGVPDDAAFVAHRHDQSVLSALATEPEWKSAIRVEEDASQFGESARPRISHHRRCLPDTLMRVAVITPTIGGPHLREAVRSVQMQTLPRVEHWIVVDGREHEDAVRACLAEFAGKRPVHVLVLPKNTGGGGWNGHRIYGAMPWIVDAPYVAYLDEDNAFEASHVEHLASRIRATGASWAHSLREIVGPDGSHVCFDNVESLGALRHTCLSPDDRLVDTSCLVLRRDVAIRTSTAWDVRAREVGKREADRELTARLLTEYPDVVVSARHSVKYRVGSGPRSVAASFFERRPTTLDFSKPVAFLFHFSPEATAAYLAALEAGRREPLAEWNMTMWHGLGDWTLVNGFQNARHAPRGSVFLAAMCDPNQLPLRLFATRSDCRRFVYTAESPNIRHQAQWHAGFLRAHFDVALTFWEPLLRNPEVRTVRCPHNSHHLDLDDPTDARVLRENRGVGRSVIICLERRPHLHGTYAIDGTTLRCLDPLREQYARGLRDLTAVGVGWKDVPGIRVLASEHRSRDPKHAVDWYQDHTFALVLENCDAAGYVSEKVYDALIAGAIPLYYGNGPIPELPEDAFVDIRKFEDGRALQTYLDSLSDEDVEAMRAVVTSRRSDILRRVGTQAIARAVSTAVVDVP